MTYWLLVRVREGVQFVVNVRSALLKNIAASDRRQRCRSMDHVTILNGLAVENVETRLMTSESEGDGETPLRSNSITL